MKEKEKRKNTMPRKKIIKFNKKNLTMCPSCGKQKAMDDSIVTAERMQLINEVMQKLDEVKLR